MKRKTITALGFSLLVFATTVPLEAQGRRGGGGMGPDLDQQMAELTEVLSLTDEQAPKVREILEMQAEKRREMFQTGAGGGDREAMRAAMMEVMEETNAMLAEVLSEEQLGLYQEHQAAQRQRRRPPF